MKSLHALLACCLATTPLARGATYHVARTGSDANSPAQAGSPNTPWRTFAPLAGVTLQAGDSILIHRGDTIRATLKIARSGTSALPIVVAAYGNGTERPVVAGSDAVAGWTRLAGDHWTARIPSSTVSRVLEHGEPRANARWPDTGWVVSSAFDGDSVVVAPVGAANWVGASALLRTAHWTLEVHKVLAQQGDRLSLQGTFRNAPEAGVRLFLTNHPSALARPETWAFVESDSTLHWFGPDPRVRLLEASVRARGLDLTGASWVRVEGIEVLGAGREAIFVKGNGVRVTDCRLVYPGLVGVSINGKTALVSRTEVVGAGNGAVVASGTGVRVEGSHLHRTARLGDIGPLGMGDGCCGGRAIDITGDSLVVRRNRVDSTGYIGVGFRGRLALVEENDIAHSCTTTDDCGGIYTYVGNYDSAGSAGTVIRRNLVRDGVGAPSGVADPWDATQGIYLDDGSHDIRVDSNTCIGNDRGIFLHNTRRVVARGNLLARNRTTPIGLSHDGLAGVGDMFDNRVEGNLFVAALGEDAAPALDVHVAQSPALGSLTENVTCRDRLVAIGCERDGAPLWSVGRVDSLDPRIGPEMFRNTSFDSVRLGWTSWPSFVRLAIDSSKACDRGKCLRVAYEGDTTTDRTGLIDVGRDVATTAGDLWWLRFRARAQHPGQSLDLIYRRAWNDYAPLGLNTSVDLDTAWKSYDFVFHAWATEARTRVDFSTTATDSVWWLDDASLRKVPQALVPADSAILILANPDSTVRNVAVEPDVWRTWSGVGTGAVATVDPYSAVALLRGGPGLAVRAQRRDTRLLAIRSLDGTLRFGNLQGPVSIRDLAGRALASIEPDAGGNASWNPSGHRGLVFATSGARSLPVLLAR